MIGVLVAAGALPLLHDVIGLTAARMLLVLGVFTLVITIGGIALMPPIPMRLLLLTILHGMFRIRYILGEDRSEEDGSQAPPTSP